MSLTDDQSQMCLQALSIFDTCNTRNYGKFYSSSHFQKSVGQVAAAAGVDPDAFRMQFEDVFPRALYEASTAAGSKDPNKSAWKTSIDKIKAHHLVAKCHPTDELVAGLVLYEVFGISSSGVEQNFSKAEWSFHSRRMSAAADTEEFVIRVILDLPQHDRQQIIKLARKIWCEVYGDSRLGGPRITRGVPRPQGINDDGLGEGVMAQNETEFITRRRQAVTAIKNDNPSCIADLETDVLMTKAAGAGGDQWKEGHDDELVFQKKKLQARKVQAVAEGAAKGSVELCAEVGLARSKRFKEQRARERKSLRDNLALKGKTQTELRDAIKGRSVCVDSSVLTSPAELDARFGQLSMTRVLMHEADVVVTQVVGKAGQRVELAIGLRGGFQVTPALLSQNVKGAGSKWKTVAAVQRTVYVSEACHVRHKNTFDFMQAVLDTMPSNKMSFEIGSWDSLKELRRKYKKSPARVIAIVRAEEKGNEELVFFTIIDCVACVCFCCIYVGLCRPRAEIWAP